MNNNKDDIKCELTHDINELIKKNSEENNYLIFNQKYISEVDDLLKYFYKINRTNKNLEI